MQTIELIDQLEEHFEVQLNESISIQHNMTDRGLHEYENIMRGKVSAYQDVLEKLDEMRELL